MTWPLILKMPDQVISDTSCIILLSKIGELDLLKELYGEIVITEEVLNELGTEVPNWLIVRNPKNTSIQQTLNHLLDAGEASIIALAFDFDNVTLILDDLKARKLAKGLNFKITGTLGVLVKAKEAGFLKKIKPTINKLLQTDFRISDKVIQDILNRADEERD